MTQAEAETDARRMIERNHRQEIMLSPSAVGKFRQCKRAFAFEYIEGLFAPSTGKQVFGTDVHSRLERWLREAMPPDDTPEGRTALQGIVAGWLPAPDSRLLIEHRFFLPVDHGLTLNGIIDCIAPPGLIGEEPLLIDHKTTSDLRWAKTPDQLAVDPQAIIYATWAMVNWDIRTVRARWIYYAASNPEDGPRKPRGSKPVEVSFHSRDDRFLGVVEGLLDDLYEMEIIRREKVKGMTLPASPESCELFGGCPHAARCNLSSGDRLAAYMERETIV